MKRIRFNEYGMIPDFPQEIMDAQRAYWNSVEPYLDELTMVEARALLYYLNLDAEMARYLIMRGCKMREVSNVNTIKE